MWQRDGHMDTGAISSQNFSVKGEDVGNEHFPILPMQMQFRGYSGTQCAHKLTTNLLWCLEGGHGIALQAMQEMKALISR